MKIEHGVQVGVHKLVVVEGRTHSDAWEVALPSLPSRTIKVVHVPGLKMIDVAQHEGLELAPPCLSPDAHGKGGEVRRSLSLFSILASYGSVDEA